MTTPPRPIARRSLRILAPLVAVGVAVTAAPAHADVPVGWSDPDPVSPLGFLIVLVLAPMACVLLIGLVLLGPGFARGEGMTGKDEHADDQWFGGRRSTAELESGSGDGKAIPARTGGASGRW
ncbi:hypothetical protein K8W59_14515 [Nocardioides rotundus]|uniref:hypothetical protein n=1 Tax=Nocardioides rotundus TaxID=1774216 RepID=UPI001CBE38CA|nr:hypothetical protein [Nocardioides rotundus]UAL29012.1 hypothetical protein K8W59_14515 [Nocardioides rotundus]